jgi:hypothetical protein
MLLDIRVEQTLKAMRALTPTTYYPPDKGDLDELEYFSNTAVPFSLDIPKQLVSLWKQFHDRPIETLLAELNEGHGVMATVDLARDDVMNNYQLPLIAERFEKKEGFKFFTYDRATIAWKEDISRYLGDRFGFYPTRAITGQGTEMGLRYYGHVVDITLAISLVRYYLYCFFETSKYLHKTVSPVKKIAHSRQLIERYLDGYILELYANDPDLKKKMMLCKQGAINYFKINFELQYFHFGKLEKDQNKLIEDFRWSL